MKSEIIIPQKVPSTNQKYKFPVLMECMVNDFNKSGAFVVLFTDETKGVVVNSQHPKRNVGTADVTWISCYDNEVWRPFMNTVTLTNDANIFDSQE